MPPHAEQGPASPTAAGSSLCKHPQLCPALLPASLQLPAAGAKAPAAVRGCTTCSSRRGCGLDTPRDAQVRPGCPAPGAQVAGGDAGGGGAGMCPSTGSSSMLLGAQMSIHPYVCIPSCPPSLAPHLIPGASGLAATLPGALALL